MEDIAERSTGAGTSTAKRGEGGSRPRAIVRPIRGAVRSVGRRHRLVGTLPPPPARRSQAPSWRAAIGIDLARRHVV
jgi:hypothetical protein